MIIMTYLEKNGSSGLSTLAKRKIITIARAKRPFCKVLVRVLAIDVDKP